MCKLTGVGKRLTTEEDCPVAPTRVSETHFGRHGHILNKGKGACGKLSLGSSCAVLQCAIVGVKLHINTKAINSEL